MGNQQQLNSLLKTMGTTNVYFQPPDNITMQYPAIVYNLDNVQTRFADNVPYSQTDRYELVVIDRDPTTEIRKKVAQIPRCVLTRTAVVDNLNHYYFTLYF